MANNNGSKPTAEQSSIQAALTGTQNAIPAKSSEVVGGVTYTQPQILAKLTGYLATYTAVETLRTQLTQAIAARVAAAADAKEFLANFKVTVVAQFGRLSSQLAQFGFGPAKVATPLTAAQKVIKAAKAQATRTLLNTKGPKQKAEAVKAANSPTVSVGSDGAISIVSPNPAPKGS
jgi:hypothetical protein